MDLVAAYGERLEHAQKVCDAWKRLAIARGVLMEARRKRQEPVPGVTAAARRACGDLRALGVDPSTGEPLHSGTASPITGEKASDAPITITQDRVSPPEGS